MGINRRHVEYASCLIGVILGLFFLYDRYLGGKPEFSGEFSISSFENAEFISFLDVNVGRVVELMAHLDASVSTPGQMRLIGYCYFASLPVEEGGFSRGKLYRPLEFDPVNSILGGRIRDLELKLPRFKGSFRNREEYLYGSSSDEFYNASDDHVSKYVDCDSVSVILELKGTEPVLITSGGTGIARFPIAGQFRVTKHYLGTTTTYKLRQLSE